MAHDARLIEELPEPPILMGHSLGGLFVQRVLDPGLRPTRDRFTQRWGGRTRMCLLAWRWGIE